MKRFQFQVKDFFVRERLASILQDTTGFSPVDGDIAWQKKSDIPEDKHGKLFVPHLLLVFI